MITREEIRRLAQIESPAGCAISFYFQPQTPHNKSHRAEAILIKDLARQALRGAERGSNHNDLREDLRRVQETTEDLHGNHSRGKAIFACREWGVWRVLDLPPRLGHSQLCVDSRFHLRPLVATQMGPSRTCVALLNRVKGRIFELDMYGEEIRQRPDLEFGSLSKTGRSDGYLGYEAGHRQRHAENELKNHFKQFAESLQLLLNQDRFEALLIGCRDEAWPELEPYLHSYLKQRLLGRLPVNPATAAAEDVHRQAQRMIERAEATRGAELVREVIGEAYRHARGAVGLRHVLTALERQEVQTLIVGGGLSAPAAECPHCRHLDIRRVRRCAVCGGGMYELSDVSDALVDLSLRNGADIQFIETDPELERVGHVAALLRFRGDQSTPMKAAA